MPPTAAAAWHRDSRVRALVATLAAIAPLTAGEPMTATAWDVRREVQEALEDVRSATTADGELAERIRKVIAQYGQALVAAKGGAAPAAEVLLAQAAGGPLAPALTAALAASAERQERQLPMHAADALLIALARAHPGTAPAERAWRRIAERAWDRGRLALGLEALHAAGALQDPRLAVMRRLDAQPVEPLPASLNGLDELWRSPLPVIEAQVAADAEEPSQQRPALPRPALSSPNGDLVALSDGQRLWVVDPLTGRLDGGIGLGDGPVSLGAVSAPVPCGDGFAASALGGPGRPVVVAVDRLGRERWRWSDEGAGWTPALSAPVLIDSLVCIAILASSDEGAELVVLALDAKDGTQVWRTTVQRVGQRWFGRGRGGEGRGGAPLLVRHGGGLLVMPHAGTVADLDSQGSVRRIWTYPSSPADPFIEVGGQPRRERGAGLVGDGRTTVATPADNPGLVLIIPEIGEPVPYRGDGADGAVVAVADGKALLLGRSAALLDLDARRLAWQVPFRSEGEVSGVIGRASGADGVAAALVADRGRIQLLNLADGAVLGAKGARSTPYALSHAGGLLVLAERTQVTAYGDALALAARLEATAAERPDDWRPLAALAALDASRPAASDDTRERAVRRWLLALDRGAPPACAESAARVLRSRLDLGGAGASRWRGLLAELADRQAGFGPELLYWDARLREESGERAAAAAGYRALVSARARLDDGPAATMGDGRRLTLADGASIDLGWLAAAGLYRTGAVASAPPWASAEQREHPRLPALATVPGVAAAPGVSAGWLRQGRRGVGLVIGGPPAAPVALSYLDGVLIAIRLGDGSEAWWRKPERATLGVRSRPGDRQGDGIPVDVLPGTSANAAGLMDGDVLLTMNGKPMLDFENDLRPTVRGLGVRGAFELGVRRGTTTLTLKGTLGGEPVEPLDADARSLLIEAQIPGNAKDSGQIDQVLDLATGAVRWSHARGANQRESASRRPVLAGPVVIAADGPDLAGFAAYDTGAAGAGATRWRLAGRSMTLAGVQALGSAGLSWQRSDVGLANLVDADGLAVVEVPCGDRGALVDRGEVFAPSGALGGPLSAWDLGSGRRRWTTTVPIQAALAAGVDGLLAIDRGGRALILDRTAGTVRRRIADELLLRTWAVDGTTAYAIGAGADGQVLVAIDAISGALAWRLRLPARATDAVLEASANGVACRMRIDNRPSAVVIGVDGRFRLGLGPGDEPASAGEPQRVIPGPGWSLVAGTRGLAAVPDPPSTGLPPIPCPVVAAPAGDVPAGDLAARLAWQQVGAMRYAVVREPSGALLIAVAGDGDLRLRLADRASGVDADAAAIETFGGGLGGDQEARVLRLTGGGGWRLRGLPAGAAGPGVIAARILPPLDLPPTAILVARAESGIATDAGPGPAWWLAAWRRLGD